MAVTEEGMKCFLFIICPINSYQEVSADKAEKIDNIKSYFNMF